MTQGESAPARHERGTPGAGRDGGRPEASGAAGSRLCRFLQLVIAAGMLLSVVQADSAGIGVALVLCGVCALSYQQSPRAAPQSRTLTILLGLLVIASGSVFLVGGLGLLAFGGSPMMMLLMMPVGVTAVLGPFVWVRVFLGSAPRRRLVHVAAFLVLGAWLWVMRPPPLPLHDTFHPYLWECATTERRGRMARAFLDRPDLPGMTVPRVEELLGPPSSASGPEGRLSYDLIPANVLGRTWLVFQVQEGVVVDGWIEEEEIDYSFD